MKPAGMGIRNPLENRYTVIAVSPDLSLVCVNNYVIPVI